MAKASYKELEALLAHVKAARAEPVVPPPAARRRGSAARKTHPARVRVLVADDHDITRRWLFHLIQHEQDLEVVGLASDGGTAVTIARQGRPDVVLLDYEMGGMNGAEAARRILADLPQTRIVCLSMYDEDITGPIMRAVGATACLEKGCSSEAVLAAIRGSLPAGGTSAKSPRGPARK